MFCGLNGWKELRIDEAWGISLGVLGRDKLKKKLMSSLVDWTADSPNGDRARVRQ